MEVRKGGLGPIPSFETTEKGIQCRVETTTFKVRVFVIIKMGLQANLLLHGCLHFALSLLA